MNINSTREKKFDEWILEKALSSDVVQGPSETSLAFIRNFARNFRVKKFNDGSMQEFVLN